MSQLEQIITTYNALLTGDNLPERVAVQTVVLQTLLDAAAATTAKPVGVRAGLEQAAKFIDQRIAEYVQEHGVTDPETGTVEFPGWGDEYVDELEELSDAIRALSPAEPVQAEKLPKDVINLIIAARDVVYGGHINVVGKEFDVLDTALEAFASRVPWGNEPDEPAAPTSKGASE